MIRGVSIIIYNPSFGILLGKRKGSHGSGSLANPGGHIEDYETVIEAGYREVKEETGIDLYEYGLHKHKLGCTIDRFGEDKTYQTYHYAVKVGSETTAELIEPDKSEFWKWYSIHEVMELWKKGELFLPLENLFRNYETTDVGQTQLAFDSWFRNAPTFSLAYLFSGPAGSGKGTQGKILQSAIGMPHIT